MFMEINRGVPWVELLILLLLVLTMHLNAKSNPKPPEVNAYKASCFILNMKFVPLPEDTVTLLTRPR